MSIRYCGHEAPIGEACPECLPPECRCTNNPLNSWPNLPHDTNCPLATAPSPSQHAFEGYHADSSPCYDDFCTERVSSVPLAKPPAALHKEGAQPTMKQLLDFLDDEVAKWAEEVHLPEIVAAITGNAEKVDAMLRQSFIEGGYRGACAASPAGRAEQDGKP